MIIVRVELHSAITGAITELARMRIANRADGTNKIGNYDVVTFIGRDRKALDKQTVKHRGEVLGHRRLALHVWRLVHKALTSVGYDKDR